MAFFGLFGKKKDEKQVAAEKQDLDQGLERSRSGFFSKLARVVAGKSTVDDAVLDDLEEVLVEQGRQLRELTRSLDLLSRKVMTDDGEVKVVTHNGTFKVNAATGVATLTLSTALDGKKTLSAKLGADGKLTLDVVGELTDQRSECEA